MADLTLTREIFAPPEGTIITPADFANITQDIDDVLGQMIRAIGGPDFLPNVNPLQIVPGSGMSVTAGGTSQGLIAQGRFLDVCAATTLPIAAAGTSDRVDLIAVMATRIAGTMTATRNVIPDSAPSDSIAIKLTLANGSASFTFNPAYSAPPVVVLGAEGVDANSNLSIAVSSTALTITNTADPTDTRTIDAYVSGVVSGASGSPQNIALLENRPAYQVVKGTSTQTPSTPSGYEALATVYVHANETKIAQTDITILFPSIPALSENLKLTSLQVPLITESVTVDGTFSATGNVYSGDGTFAAPAGQPNIGFAPNNVVKALLDQNGDFSTDGGIASTGNIESGNGVFTAPAGVTELQLGPNNEITATLDQDGNLRTTGGIASTGNISAGDGTYAAPSGIPLAFAPGNATKATLDTSGNFVAEGEVTSDVSMNAPAFAATKPTNFLTWPPVAAGIATAGLASAAAKVMGVAANILGIFITGGQAILGIDSNGNMGLLGTLAAAAVSAANITASGNISADSFSGPLVNSINGLTGSASVESPDGTIGVSTNGENITIDVALTSSDSSVDATVDSGGYNLTVPFGRIGDVVTKIANITGNATTNLNIGALPRGTWNLIARAEGTMTSGALAVSGSGASWDSSNSASGSGGNTSVAIVGTASAGQAPSAKVTIGNQGGGSIVFTLTAVCVG